MIHGLVLDSRGYGFHDGFSVICFLVKNPDDENTVTVITTATNSVGFEFGAHVINDVPHTETEPAWTQVDVYASIQAAGNEAKENIRTII